MNEIYHPREPRPDEMSFEVEKGGSIRHFVKGPSGIHEVPETQATEERAARARKAQATEERAARARVRGTEARPVGRRHPQCPNSTCGFPNCQCRPPLWETRDETRGFPEGELMNDQDTAVRDFIRADDGAVFMASKPSEVTSCDLGPGGLMADQDTAQYGGGSTMPTDSAARKGIPIATGLLDYFPDACIAVAEISHLGNQKHNPGEPLHWARGKGGNNADEAARHFLQRGKMDELMGVKIRHTAFAAWRIFALLQLEIEAARARGEPK